VPFSYREKGELKTREVFLILDQLADIGCFYLGFTGGEPFVRKDILDILRYAGKLGFEIIIYTNGFLINEKVADDLAILKPNKVDITIPAMTKKPFERITKSSGSYEKFFKAIDLLRKRKVALGFKTCLLKENSNEIKDIQDFAHSLNAFHRLDDTLSRRLDGSGEPYSYRPDRKSLQLGDFNECSDYPNIRKNLHLFKCGVGVSQAAITPSGELKMCLMIEQPKYKILQSSLSNAWKKLKKAAQAIKPDKNYKCDICKLKDYCKWCPARSWLYHKNFTSCEPECRKKAERVYLNYANKG
jgi:radical SAM protein with 4Fe4S-binding SPASM domain